MDRGISVVLVIEVGSIVGKTKSVAKVLVSESHLDGMLGVDLKLGSSSLKSMSVRRTELYGSTVEVKGVGVLCSRLAKPQKVP